MRKIRSQNTINQTRQAVDAPWYHNETRQKKTKTKTKLTMGFDIHFICILKCTLWRFILLFCPMPPPLKVTSLPHLSPLLLGVTERVKSRFHRREHVWCGLPLCLQDGQSAVLKAILHHGIENGNELSYSVTLKSTVTLEELSSASMALQ